MITGVPPWLLQIGICCDLTIINQKIRWLKSRKFCFDSILLIHINIYKPYKPVFWTSRVTINQMSRCPGCVWFGWLASFECCASSLNSASWSTVPRRSWNPTWNMVKSWNNNIYMSYIYYVYIYIIYVWHIYIYILCMTYIYIYMYVWHICIYM